MVEELKNRQFLQLASVSDLRPICCPKGEKNWGRAPNTTIDTPCKTLNMATENPTFLNCMTCLKGRLSVAMACFMTRGISVAVLTTKIPMSLQLVKSPCV